MEQDNKIILFQEKQVRRVWHNAQWYFSIIDVVGILTENERASKYWNDIKRKLTQEGAWLELSEKIGKFKFLAADGKMRSTECANRQTLLRIIMSVPSPKAEPFKLWLAQIGEEHIQEIENPELGMERIRALYKAKGYADEWIERRMQSIETRKQLTEEWKNRGVKEGQEYAILTAEIAKATFGLTPSEHSRLKGLEKQNLRDHMTPLELIFTALGEEVTRSIAVAEDAQGFEENRDAALQGGKLAGDARERVERDRRVKVVSAQNFLNQIERAEKQNGLPEEKEDK
ncbi:MAG: Bro-N domain-containing protein [Saprospiraceae bacterium]|nr:Bro-N domain-containing protein [Saprospiraceae bacterium]